MSDDIIATGPRWTFVRRHQLDLDDVLSWVSVVPPPNANVDLREAQREAVSDNYTISRVAENGMRRLSTETVVEISHTCERWLRFWRLRHPDPAQREQLRAALTKSDAQRAKMQRLALKELRRRGHEHEMME
jgi:hypothetical protein